MRVLGISLWTGKVALNKGLINSVELKSQRRSLILQIPTYRRTLTILCSGQITTTWRSMERKPRKWSSVLKKVPSFIPPLKINGLDIDKVTISKLLGIYVSSHLKWGPHVDKIHAKAFKRLLFSHAWRGQVLKKTNCLTTMRASWDL